MLESFKSLMGRLLGVEVAKCKRQPGDDHEWLGTRCQSFCGFHLVKQHYRSDCKHHRHQEKYSPVYREHALQIFNKERLSSPDRQHLPALSLRQLELYAQDLRGRPLLTIYH